MRTLLKLFLPLALLLVAVAPAAAADETPAPEAVPYLVSSYSGTLPIATPEDAHAAVLAAGGPFDEFTYNDGALIGATKYYDVKGEPGSDAIWIVVYTYGWNDCEAGCINGHSFVYQVDPLTGAATFDSHQGDVLPADAPAALVELTGRSGGVPPEPEWRTVTGEPTACPEGITEPNAPISSDTVLPCLLPDGSLFPIVLEDGVDGDTDWATMYSTWMEEFRDSLEPCAADVDVNDPMVTTCVLPDGTIVGPVPLFAMNMPGIGEEDNGWTTALPTIILAALLAWIGAATLVGWSKRRAA
ncbi:MAG: hypothetical protein DWI32_00625 [Candidatus Aquidulcis sp.]|uniref:Uncharacterized protein n=1 Tax=freshwater metagenome TaxID=449393 RepID=A0A094PX99_9ZZZZ|nr:MAG: hypothetical protein DWI32_00625 [Candidatus Aquidulcis sp.]